MARCRFTRRLDYDGPILSVIGFNSHRFAGEFVDFGQSVHPAHGANFVSKAVFKQCVLEARANVLAFYRLLLQENRAVYLTHSPNRCPAAHLATLQAFEAVMVNELEAMGARFIDVRGQCLVDGQLKPEYCRPGDGFHANSKYGAQVIDQLIAECATDAVF
ncbi:hypothetical protein NHF40_01885 [Maricaulaceae bacterium EIL42A08]|nr:hypothetical protein [Maricaulaceae bacterium EIL42A08]